LFFAKWRQLPEAATFLTYFEEWTAPSRATWYEGYFILGPSTNNALESENARIKGKLLRERLSLNKFLHKLEHDVICSWSLARAPGVNQKQIALVPEPAKNDWKAAKEMQEDKSRAFFKCNNYIVVNRQQLQQTFTPDLAQQAVKDFVNCSWETFEEFEQWSDNYCILQHYDETDLLCTCSWCMKNHFCVHTLCYQLRKGWVKLPTTPAEDVPLERQRKRGRPKKAAKALIVM
jgi:hypothetical protein